MSRWEQTAKSLRVPFPVPPDFSTDAKALLPFGLVLIHFSYTTVIIACVSTILFGVLEYRGYTLPVFFRVVRCFIAGQTRPCGSVLEMRLRSRR